MRLRDKLKKWLFADELKKIEALETCYKDKIKWCTEMADNVYHDSIRARYNYEQCETELKECRRLLTQLCDIGVDIGFSNDEHSWAVICIAGKTEYVKFLPLHRDNAKRVFDFLKQFEYSKPIIDSPIAYRHILKDKIFNPK